MGIVFASKPLRVGVTCLYSGLSLFATMGKEKGGLQQVMQDLLIGGISGAVTKTAMSPIERVKLLMQTQDSNPDVISGKVQRYTSLEIASSECTRNRAWPLSGEEILSIAFDTPRSKALIGVQRCH